MSYALAPRSRRGRSRRGLGEVTLPATILTPGEVVAAADRINRAVNALNADVRQHMRLILCGASAPATGTCTPNTEGVRFNNEWIQFVSEWIRFYQPIHIVDVPESAPSAMASFLAQIRTAGSYTAGSLASELHEKGDAYNAFEQRYQTLTGMTPTATTHEYVSWSEWFSRLGNTGMMWAGIGIVGLGVTGYLLSQWAKVRTVSKLALNPRRRRRRRRRLR